MNSRTRNVSGDKHWLHR